VTVQPETVSVFSGSSVETIGFFPEIMVWPKEAPTPIAARHTTIALNLLSIMTSGLLVHSKHTRKIHSSLFIYPAESSPFRDTGK
jgi:hypothetical protein